MTEKPASDFGELSGKRRSTTSWARKAERGSIASIPKPKGPYERCPDCGGWKAVKAYRCRSCTPRIREAALMRRKENPTPSALRTRTRLRHKLPDVCERCKQNKRLERHHIDGNPGNDDPANIACLCRLCHMQVDGRLVALQQRNRDLPPCRHCGRAHRSSLGFRHGLCSACRSWRVRNGDDRPLHLIDESGRVRKPPPDPRPCDECHRLVTILRRGLCGACNERKRRRIRREAKST